MANFFISYDLMAPGQHYERVQKAIKDFGSWAQIEYSMFYVSSSSPLSEIFDHIWNAMDANDKLIVIDSTNDNAEMRNLDPDVTSYIVSNWRN